jgi:hypothetical protein
MSSYSAVKGVLFSRTGKSIAVTPCHYETECSRDVFPYQVRTVCFRSQSIYLVINFQWWCFELTTFLDRTIPYGLCPGPIHHPSSAITIMASCLAAVLIFHEPGSTLSLQLIWALFFYLTVYKSAVNHLIRLTDTVTANKHFFLRVEVLLGFIC